MTTRQFSLPTVLRMTPNALLKLFFEQAGHAEFDPHWNDLTEREIDPLLDYMTELPSQQSNEIEASLRGIFDLSCESGINAIMEAGPLCAVTDLGESISEDLSLYGKAMWVWVNRRDVFELATSLHQVDLINWWRKRKDLPKVEPDKSAQAKLRFEDEISTLLKSEGRGKDCTVEMMSRGGVDYFFAHPDDFVQCVTVHDADGKLAPQTLRQTMLAVFAYKRAEGSLETFAKLPKRHKEQLEVIFSKNILHWDLGPHDPGAVYELNQLKDPSFDLRPDPEDQLVVRLRKLRLSAKYNGRRVLVEVDDADPDDSMHRAIEECINLERSPLSEWNVTLATFCFEFLPLNGRKPGRTSFDVSYPRSCGLRNARPERIEIIQKYLRRWNIDQAPSDVEIPIEMGS